MSGSPQEKTNYRAPEGAMDDLRNETRVLRRRVNFWQRTAWLLLGTLVIFATVIWQRGELRRRECAYALLDYGETALKRQLGSTSSEMLEAQWQALEPVNAKISPSHYDLIARNWQLTPKPGELIPLAVCREPHSLATSRGRHVLLRGVKPPLQVEWRSEESVEPLVREAAADNHVRTGA